MQARVSVYIAEDHPVYRDGLARAVSRRGDLQLVGQAGDGRTALEEIRTLAPDVVTLDLHLPELDGLRVLNAIKRDALPCRVLVLSSSSTGAGGYDAVALGAAGYLSKESAAESICDAIAAIARGETILAGEVQRELAGELQLRAAGGRPLLTARELEILRLIAAGRSAPEIAKSLFLSVATVKTHMQHLYDKLGVADRAAAVAAGMRRGLLE